MSWNGSLGGGARRNRRAFSVKWRNSVVKPTLGPIQIAEKPPSTDNSTPFTKLASSEARNSATVANFLRTPYLSPWDQGFRKSPSSPLSSRWESSVSTCPRAEHVHPDIPALQFVEPRSCEWALGSESAWEGAVFEIPVSTNTDSSGEVGHALISVGSSTAKWRSRCACWMRSTSDAWTRAARG